MLEKLKSENNIWGINTARVNGKTVGEYSDHDWKKILNKVDSVLEASKEDLEKEKAENLKRRIQNTKVEGTMSEKTLQRLVGDAGRAPYSRMADENGFIKYNGIRYYCDFKKNQICLGDMKDIDHILVIPLRGGGTLMLNRDNLDDLEKSIELFSPADISIIMRAIAQDNKLKQMQQELEDETSGLQVRKNPKKKGESA